MKGCDHIMFGFITTPLETALTDTIDTLKEEDFCLTDNLLHKLEILQTNLKTLTLESIEELEPEEYFYEHFATSVPDCLIYLYYTQLIELKEGLTELEIGCDSELLKDTFTMITQKIALLNKVVESSAKKIFSKKLAHLMDKNNCDQRELALYLQISQQQVSAYLQGVSYPSVPKLIQLAIYFETSVDFLTRPDAVEASLEVSELYKTVGITPNNSRKLKDLVKRGKTDTLETINTLIAGLDSHYTDLLSAITEYMTMPTNSSLHIISDDQLADLTFAICNVKTVKEMKAIINDFAKYNFNNVENEILHGKSYDIDKALLLVVTETLIRLRTKKLSETY